MEKTVVVAAPALVTHPDSIAQPLLDATIHNGLRYE